jgi:hypothetical protein
MWGGLCFGWTAGHSRWGYEAFIPCSDHASDRAKQGRVRTEHGVAFSRRRVACFRLSVKHAGGCAAPSSALLPRAWTGRKKDRLQPTTIASDRQTATGLELRPFCPPQPECDAATAAGPRRTGPGQPTRARPADGSLPQAASVTN